MTLDYDATSPSRATAIPRSFHTRSQSLFPAPLSMPLLNAPPSRRLASPCIDPRVRGSEIENRVIRSRKVDELKRQAAF